MKNGFTITELLVAIGLMAVIMAVSGTVFRVAIESERTAAATSEIARRLGAITAQLDSDFGGLQKNGQIFITWVARPVREGLFIVDDDGDGMPDEYHRFDRILFFADGNFKSYYEWPVLQADGVTVLDERLNGNFARVSYMLARPEDAVGGWPGHTIAYNQQPSDRVLGRSQHILTTQTILDPDDPSLTTPAPFSDLATIPIPFTQADNQFWEMWNNTYEHENEILTSWVNAGLIEKEKMLTICTGIIVNLDGDPANNAQSGGLTVDTDADETLYPLDPANPPEKNIHMLVSEGVGYFSVQGWFEAEQRWFPEVDPDGDGDLSDTDFGLVGGLIDEANYPGVLYPNGFHMWGPDLTVIPSRYSGPLDEVNFNNIPGLGKALKFTFTLYDSKGIFKDGKMFTHIVYLN